MYILYREEGYSREIARTFGSDPDSIQKQLVKFEDGGIFISKFVGKTKVYSFNPRYPFLSELKALLEKAFTFYPEDLRSVIKPLRRRPRRAGKPL